MRYRFGGDDRRRPRIPIQSSHIRSLGAMINVKSPARLYSFAPVSSIALGALLVACSHAGGQVNGGAGASAATTTPANCTPLETRAANAASQRPAFAGQTRT